MVVCDYGLACSSCLIKACRSTHTIVSGRDNFSTRIESTETQTLLEPESRIEATEILRIMAEVSNKINRGLEYYREVYANL